MSFNILARRSKLRLTWIPKNMCSTLKLSFAVAEGVISPDDMSLFQTNPKWIHDWMWPLEAKHPLELSAGLSVAVLRNPESRLRSALLEKAIYQPDDEFDRIVRPLLAHYSHYIRRSVPDMTFADLLAALQWAPDRALDSHFVSQVAFLGGVYDRFLRLEDRAATTAFFASRDILLHTVDAHATSRMTGEPVEIAADEPVLSVRSTFHGQDPAPRRFDAELEDGLAKLAASRYASDVELWARGD